MPMLRHIEREAWHPDGATLLDPCAGDGAICRAVRQQSPWVPECIELNEAHRTPLARACGYAEADVRIMDGLTYRGRLSNSAVGVLTNTPFSGFEHWIARWAPGRSFAAFLLRINALGGQARADWWRKYRPAALCVLPKRVAFVAVCKGKPKTKASQRVKGCGRSYPIGTGGTCECGGQIADGTDSCEYAWFTYGHRVEPGIYHLTT